MTTEMSEIVATLYKSTIMSQTEEVLRPSGMNRIPKSALLVSLGSSEIKTLLSMLVLTGLMGREDSFAAAVASGVTYGYEASRMANATSLLLTNSYRQGVEISGTDVQVSYQELTEISEQILSLATEKMPEVLQEQMLNDESKYTYCVVFGAELAKYHRGLAELDAVDFTTAPPGETRDDLVSPEEQAVKEAAAWNMALNVTMGRVADIFDNPERAVEHTRLGDHMPDVFKETMASLSSAVHDMVHEKGGAGSECGTEEHQITMMRAMFMFGRAVEEMATSRLAHLDELRFNA